MKNGHARANMSTERAKIKDTQEISILERIANNDQTACEECVRKYGDWIWRLAKLKTDSNKAAEDLTMAIFTDIWKFAHRFKHSGQTEKIFVSLIAWRLSRRKIKPVKRIFGADNRFYKAFKKYADTDRR